MSNLNDIFAKHADSFARYQEMARTVDRFSSTLALTTQNSGIGAILADMQKNQSIFDSGLRDSFRDTQLRVSLSFVSHLQQHVGAMESIARQSEAWTSLVNSALPKISSIGSMSHIGALSVANSALAWESSTRRIYDRSKAVGLLERDHKSVARLLSMGKAFSEFASSTASRLASLDDDRSVWALETSLRVAEEQLLASSDVVDGIIELPDDLSEPADARSQLVPFRQQEELLKAAPDIEIGDDESLLKASPTIARCDLARDVLVKAKTCNDACKISGGVEIFKPTNRLLEVYADMPWIQSEDKRSFADFVDCLYFLFYEGAGKDNLRFLSKNGGPLGESDCDFIWCVKHLRNKWTRHDVDHGSDSSIRRSWQQLSTQFAWLGASSMPVTADDFKLMQLVLLTKASEFTDKLISGVTNS